MDKFNQAFQYNFYQTKEFADFCSKITKIPLEEKIIENEKIFVLKNKNISIGNYSNSFCREMQAQNIQYMQILPELNSVAERPSYIEYSIFHKTIYEAAFKSYRSSFADALRKGRKFPHETKIIRRPSGSLIKKIYEIYSRQMKRHNSFIFSQTFFENFFACPSAFLFLVEHQQIIIAYFCCFQYKGCIYVSIGGGDPRYFNLQPSNKIYDELIRYACQKKLDIHFGIGEHNSGYQQFKQNAGLLCYKTERFPNNEKFLKLTAPLLNFNITGKFLALVSGIIPYSITYLVMPFS